MKNLSTNSSSEIFEEKEKVNLLPEKKFKTEVGTSFPPFFSEDDFEDLLKFNNKEERSDFLWKEESRTMRF